MEEGTVKSLKQMFIDGVKLFFSAEFWSKKEISYQFIHMFLGMLIAKGVCWLILPEPVFGIVCAFAAGTILEVYQYIMGESLKLTDRFRDILFWTIGGFFLFI